jgi:hypothetical protein
MEENKEIQVKVSKATIDHCVESVSKYCVTSSNTPSKETFLGYVEAMLHPLIAMKLREHAYEEMKKEVSEELYKKYCE